MVITDSVIWKGKENKLIWTDSDNFDNLPLEKLIQSYGVCFCGDKLVVGKNSKGKWALVGGHIEKGETQEQTLEREVVEESNMRVLKQTPIGYQEVIESDGKTYFQLRSVCLVEPIGKFEKDPAGSVTEIKLIDPKDYKNYFDWGKIGDRVIDRALEVKESLDK